MAANDNLGILGELNTNILALTAAINTLVASGAIGAGGTAPAAAGKGKKAGAKDEPGTDNAGASSGATGTQSASTASSNASGAPDWKATLELIKSLDKSTAAGHGRPAVTELVTQFLPGGNVPGLEALNKNAEITAWVNARMKPAAEVDPFA